MYKLYTPLIILACSLLAVIFVLLVPKDEGWTCSNTGSRKGNTSFLGIITSDYYDKSPIEHWMEEHNQSVNHVWLINYSSNYIGLNLDLKTHCYITPLIADFSFCLQKEFLKSSSYEEIEQFLEKLKSNNVSYGDKRELLNDVINKMFDKIYKKNENNNMPH